jgi:ACS family tartrate transporter-like MFS transporter
LITDSPSPETKATPTALQRATRKAYWRLLPLLFLCYVIAFVDRSNVAIGALTMVKDLPGFDNAVIGLGAGMFFLGYILLEIPGSLIVERWSARKWICRIMLTWGLMAALTGFVRTPGEFYSVRFLLGLAEAGFFPGVVVYLTHWFPARDRGRALAYFFIATPVAQIVSPHISFALLKIGTEEVINGLSVYHPLVLGLRGWQWLYIFWGFPALALGVVVWFLLTDHPRDAKWLTAEEREALEQELARENARPRTGHGLTVLQALKHRKVLFLTFAYFCTVTGSYGVVFFLPTILQQWYALNFNKLTWLVMLPPLVALVGQLVVGWSSDRTRERRLHTVMPIAIGALAMALTPLTQGNLFATIACMMVAMGGLKAYLPAFWALPSMLLTSTAAAGAIGFINTVGSLGGFLGPYVLGKVQAVTGSFVGGLYFLAVSMLLSATIIFLLGLGRREER